MRRRGTEQLCGRFVDIIEDQRKGKGRGTHYVEAK